MAWCEAEAAAAARHSRAEGCEIWLAVQETNEAARLLYESLGFAGDDDLVRRGHVIMRKTVPAAAAEAAPGTGDASPALRGPAASYDVINGFGPGPGGAVGALAAEAAPSVLFAGVASLGASALVAPFFFAGRGAPAPLAMGAALVGTPLDALGDVAVGLAAAAAAEALRPGDDDDADVLEALAANPSLAGQKAALWRVTGGGTLSPLAAVVAIGLWQLAAAASEELYYRALLQNGATLALASLSGSQLLGDAVALVATTALFALAHAGWVDDDDGDDPAKADADAMSADEMRDDWLRGTAPFGLLFGVLFAATGHRLLAPLACHTALNTYWSALDAAKLRDHPDRSKLAALFDATAPSR